MQTSFAVRPARVDRALTPTLRAGPFAYQDVAVLGDVAACPQVTRTAGPCAQNGLFC